MLATFTPTASASVNTETETRTLEFVTPTVLRCHCQEYRTNHFCLHLVYYAVAKIRAFQERDAEQTKLTYHQVARRGYCGECGKRTNQMGIVRNDTYPYVHKHFKCAKCQRAQFTKGQSK